MSLPHIPDPIPGDAASADAIEAVIVPRARDLGGFEVRPRSHEVRAGH